MSEAAKSDETLLNSVVKTEQILNPKFVRCDSTVRGDNFLGIVYRAKILGDNKKLGVVIKKAHKEEFFRKKASIVEMYFHETYFYDTIYPAFSKFQGDRGVTDPFDAIPKCYATSMDVLDEGLALEDLTDRGYKLCDRRRPMDANHIAAVLRVYGKFHALSFAMKDQERELYQRITSKVTDIFERLTTSDTYSDLFTTVCVQSKSVLNPESDKEAWVRFDDFCGRVREFQAKFCTKCMDYSVLIHGDCWTNNILFQYQDETNPNIPTSVRLIDFQLSRICTPISDIVHFFYTCSPKDVQDNYRYYLDVYYTSLVTHLDRLGSKPENVFPRAVFEEHFKKYCQFGLIKSLFMAKLTLCDERETPDFAEAAEAGQSMMDMFSHEVTNENYRERVRNVIMHFVDNNFI